MAAITLRVYPRGKPIRSLPAQVSLQSSDTTQSLYHQIAKASGYSPQRLRISLGEDGSQVIENSAKSTLTSMGAVGSTDIFVKDLGPQIDWRTVYVVEYLGPLIIHPLIYALRLTHPTPSQTLTLYMIMAQFLKRELETNSAHYWLLSGAMVAWFVYTPSRDTPESDPSTMLSYVGLALFILGASLNTHVHLLQRSFRPAGTTLRRVPSGIGFGWVTCPNYMFETLAWIGVLLVSRSWAVLVFLIVGVAQMKAWATKKEKRYRREFPVDYVPKKYGIMPGIL
ncbi:synaptic glycoprotein SC2 [Xylaria longipes]|nr:synaptic glycoprotein SC2 [Xylaria longipes]